MNIGKSNNGASYFEPIKKKTKSGRRLLNTIINDIKK